MYHRVLPKETKQQSFSHPGIIVSMKTFDTQITFLKKHFNFISAEIFVEHLEQHQLFPDRSCLITFDDGWYDNYENAFPILSKHRIPALIFLSTAFIDSNKLFWQESITSLLYHIYQDYQKNPSGREKYRRLLAAWQLDSILDRQALGLKSYLFDVVSAFKKRKINTSELRTQLEALKINDHSQPRVDRFMSWKEIREMISQNISFGSHGMNHLRFSEIDEVTMDSELSSSKRMIEEKIGSRTGIYFSYPNGDYTDLAKEKVAQNGYRAAFGTKPGTVTIKDDRFSLKRINIHEDMTSHLPMFYCRILGIL
jgi:peptidoglycan/xylan/chitin deacetylase (PgdA/CDA1 family)